MGDSSTIPPLGPITSRGRWFSQTGCTKQFPLTDATMTESNFQVYKFVKLVFISVFIVFLSVFTIASIRTFSLDVNVGLQLARWEKTNNILLVIDHHQREELLAKFKGT